MKFTQSGGVGLRVTCEARSLAISVTDTRTRRSVRPPRGDLCGLRTGGRGARAPAWRHRSRPRDFEAPRRAHGWAAFACAILRQGSTFAISLPLPPDTVRSEPDPSMSGQRVLIASPSRFEAAYLERALAVVRRCDDPCHELNWRRFRSCRTRQMPGAPDTVLIDCAFGEFATIALAEAARQAGAKRLFVLFSPTERRELRAETLRGFDGWLVKPVRAASLFARLAPEAQPRRLRAPMTSDIVPKLRGVRVLLAEDNEISRRVALKHLERHGACVTCAADGAEAVRIADANRFDVIILDVRMPVLDGLGAARRIRSSEPSDSQNAARCAHRQCIPGRQARCDRRRDRLFPGKARRPVRSRRPYSKSIDRPASLGRAATGVIDNRAVIFASGGRVNLCK